MFNPPAFQRDRPAPKKGQVDQQEKDQVEVRKIDKILQSETYVFELERNQTQTPVACVDVIYPSTIEADVQKACLIRKGW